MELMKRLLKAKGLHQAVMFHDVRWGAEHEGRFLWVLLNSGSCGAYAFNHDPTRSPASTRTGSRRSTSRRPAARSPARASRRDDLGARVHRARACSGWTSGEGEVVEAAGGGARRLVGRARRASGRSWPPTWAAPWTRSWRTTCRTTSPSRMAMSSARWSLSRRSSASRCASSAGEMSPTMSDAASLYLGVDVGTASVRAGLFDAAGKMHRHGRRADHDLSARDEDFVEQSADDIWAAAGVAVREALEKAGATPTQSAGIGFDATCSLVALSGDDEPVTVSPTGDDARNVIVWMDHRATDQAARINATPHEVLRYVGGGVSPEMQTPKLLWLKEELPADLDAHDALPRSPRFPRLPRDGDDVRSLCTTVCKWTYLAHDGRGWQARGSSARSASAILADEGLRADRHDRPPDGERAGTLTEARARARARPRDSRSPWPSSTRTPGASASIGAGIDGPRRRRTSRRSPLANRGHVELPHGGRARAAVRSRGVGAVLVRDGPGLLARRGGAVGDGRARSTTSSSRTPAGPSCSARRRQDDAPRSYALLNARRIGGPRPRPAVPRRRSRATCTCSPITTEPLAPRRPLAARHGLGPEAQRFARPARAPLPGDGPGHRARHPPHRRRACARTATPSRPSWRAAGARARTVLPARARRRDRVPHRPSRASRRRCSSAPRSSARSRAATERRCGAMGAMSAAGRVIQPAGGRSPAILDAKYASFSGCTRTRSRTGCSWDRRRVAAGSRK